MLSICFHFVDEKKDIRDRFLEFLEIPRLTGSVMGNVILNLFEYKGIGVKTVEENAMTLSMQSKKPDVSSVIISRSPKACTTHCCSHNLSLSTAKCENQNY